MNSMRGRLRWILGGTALFIAAILGFWAYDLVRIYRSANWWPFVAINAALLVLVGVMVITKIRASVFSGLLVLVLGLNGIAWALIAPIQAGDGYYLAGQAGWKDGCGELFAGCTPGYLKFEPAADLGGFTGICNDAYAAHDVYVTVQSAATPLSPQDALVPLTETHLSQPTLNFDGVQARALGWDGTQILGNNGGGGFGSGCGVKYAWDYAVQHGNRYYLITVYPTVGAEGGDIPVDFSSMRQVDQFVSDWKWGSSPIDLRLIAGAVLIVLGIGAMFVLARNRKTLPGQ
jgi:hypothetical protein